MWHDGSGGGKQLGQKAKEALDRSKVWRLFLNVLLHPVLRKSTLVLVVEQSVGGQVPNHF